MVKTVRAKWSEITGNRKEIDETIIGKGIEEQSLVNSDELNSIVHRQDEMLDNLQRANAWNIGKEYNQGDIIFVNVNYKRLSDAVGKTYKCFVICKQDKVTAEPFINQKGKAIAFSKNYDYTVTQFIIQVDDDNTALTHFINSDFWEFVNVNDDLSNAIKLSVSNEAKLGSQGKDSSIITFDRDIILNGNLDTKGTFDIKGNLTGGSLNSNNNIAWGEAFVKTPSFLAKGDEIVNAEWCKVQTDYIEFTSQDDVNKIKHNIMTKQEVSKSLYAECLNNLNVKSEISYYSFANQFEDNLDNPFKSNAHIIPKWYNTAIPPLPCGFDFYKGGESVITFGGYAPIISWGIKEIPLDFNIEYFNSLQFLHSSYFYSNNYIFYNSFNIDGLFYTISEDNIRYLHNWLCSLIWNNFAYPRIETSLEYVMPVCRKLLDNSNYISVDFSQDFEILFSKYLQDKNLNFIIGGADIKQRIYPGMMYYDQYTNNIVLPLANPSDIFYNENNLKNNLKPKKYFYDFIIKWVKSERKLYFIHFLPTYNYTSQNFDNKFILDEYILRLRRA